MLVLVVRLLPGKKLVDVSLSLSVFFTVFLVFRFFFSAVLPLLLRWLTAGVSLPRMFVGPVGFVPFRLDFL